MPCPNADKASLSRPALWEQGAPWPPWPWLGAPRNPLWACGQGLRQCPWPWLGMPPAETSAGWEPRRGEARGCCGLRGATGVAQGPQAPEPCNPRSLTAFTSRRDGVPPASQPPLLTASARTPQGTQPPPLKTHVQAPAPRTGFCSPTQRSHEGCHTRPLHSLPGGAQRARRRQGGSARPGETSPGVWGVGARGGKGWPWRGSDPASPLTWERHGPEPQPCPPRGRQGQ